MTVVYEYREYYFAFEGDEEKEKKKWASLEL